MNRLLGIRHGSVTPATTIEDALDTVHDIWAAYLAGIDIVDSHDWTLHGGQAALARGHYSDHVELAQRFSHRHGAALPLDDEPGGIVTIGDLVAPIAMLAVLLHKVRPDITQRFIVPEFLHLGQRYEAVVTGVGRGSRPRTGPRAHTRHEGAPPAQTHHTSDENSERQYR